MAAPSRRPTRPSQPPQPPFITPVRRPYTSQSQAVTSLTPADPNSVNTKKRKRQLPDGPCNYRDINLGPTPPTCGCRRFWEHEEDKWDCVCGHHACYHDKNEKGSFAGSTLSVTTDTGKVIMSPQIVVQQESEQQPVGHEDVSEDMEAEIITNLLGDGDALRPGLPRSSSNLSASGLPRIPSMLLLDANKPRSSTPKLDSESPPLAVPMHETPSRPAGLGLFLRDKVNAQRIVSPTPTVADPTIVYQLPGADSQLPSTRQASTIGSVRNTSPDSNIMRQAMEARMRGPPIDLTNIVRSEMPGAQEILLSATEMATPSLAGTPDFVNLGRLIGETRNVAEAIGPQSNHHVDRSSAHGTGAMTLPTQLLDRSQQPSLPPITSTASLDVALRSLPSTLQQLLPHLDSLQSHLSSYSNLSIVLQGLTDRVSLLETASFAVVPPDVFQERYDLVDTRLIDLEQRSEEHARRLMAVENIHAGSDIHGRETRGSFTSNQSQVSQVMGDSAALLAASIERAETDARMKDIEDRLGDLETTAPPTLACPWEIEVVLLPWGRELRGIWLSAEEHKNTGSKTFTQDEEEWTQAARSLSKPSSSFHASDSSGWSSQAIHAWAEDTEEWLSPKACGTNGLVYHRLKSRGLVRKVVLQSSSARDIQGAIKSAFGKTLRTISNFTDKDQDSQMLDVDERTRQFLALSAPYVPLRKMHKSSKLHFLTPAEMSTPALWTSDFLASGIMMRAAGGHKRLFVTQPEAYLQRSDADAVAWTWSKIEQLPKPTLAPRGEDDEILAETVANLDSPGERCWDHCAKLDDPPPSHHTSFTSMHSGRSRGSGKALTPAQPYHTASKSKEDIDTRSIATRKDDYANYPAPITPISEFPTQVGGSRDGRRIRRQRTASMPATELSLALADSDVRRHRVFNAEHDGSRDAVKKRRIRSFEASANPLLDVLPTFIPASSLRDIEAEKRATKEKDARLRKRRKIHAGKPRERSMSADMADYSPRINEEDDDTVFSSAVDSSAQDEARPASSSSVRNNRTTQRFLADLHAMQARHGHGMHVCRELGCPDHHSLAEEDVSSASISASASGGIGKDTQHGNRQITPFAYATPYSGPLVKIESDSVGEPAWASRAHAADEEAPWEGVGEEADEARTRRRSQRLVHDDEVASSSGGSREDDDLDLYGGSQDDSDLALDYSDDAEIDGDDDNGLHDSHNEEDGQDAIMETKEKQIDGRRSHPPSTVQRRHSYFDNDENDS